MSGGGVRCSLSHSLFLSRVPISGIQMYDVVSQRYKIDGV